MEEIRNFRSDISILFLIKVEKVVIISNSDDISVAKRIDIVERRGRRKPTVG